jgi:hypothetical protein
VSLDLKLAVTHKKSLQIPFLPETSHDTEAEAELCSMCLSSEYGNDFESFFDQYSILWLWIIIIVIIIVVIIVIIIIIRINK